ACWRTRQHVCPRESHKPPRPSDALPLRTDIDLLPPVDLAVGELAAQTGIAAKLWALELADLLLRLGRQCEELPRQREHLVTLRAWHTVIDEVEEAAVVGCFAQPCPKR